MFDEKDWEIFKQKLKKRTGIDLDLYKAAQMQRRIGNLMQRNGHTSYAAFFDSIEGDKAAFESFIEYLTINVSEFFRTPEKFSNWKRMCCQICSKKAQSSISGVLAVQSVLNLIRWR